MCIHPLHAAHIRRVKVGFMIIGETLDPQRISREVGLRPDRSLVKGAPRPHMKSVAREGFWSVESSGRLSGEDTYTKDINSHFEVLMDLIYPRIHKIITASQGFERLFNVLWESTYLYAGTGPVISAENLAKIGLFDAEMGFDIYQVNE